MYYSKDHLLNQNQVHIFYIIHYFDPILNKNMQYKPSDYYLHKIIFDKLCIIHQIVLINNYQLYINHSKVFFLDDKMYIILSRIHKFYSLLSNKIQLHQFSILLYILCNMLIIYQHSFLISNHHLQVNIFNYKIYKLHLFQIMYNFQVDNILHLQAKIYHNNYYISKSVQKKIHNNQLYINLNKLKKIDVYISNKLKDHQKMFNNI